MKSHLPKVFLKMNEYSATLLHKQKLKQKPEKLKTATFKPDNFLRLDWDKDLWKKEYWEYYNCFF